MYNTVYLALKKTKSYLLIHPACYFKTTNNPYDIVFLQGFVIK